MISTSFSSLSSDNPVTVQNAQSTCLCPSTNKHLNYDEVEICKKLLTEDQGKVSEREYCDDQG